MPTACVMTTSNLVISCSTFKLHKLGGQDAHPTRVIFNSIMHIRCFLAYNVSSMNLSLPASLSETEREEQRKIQLFAPLSDTERGWGKGQIRLVELTLI